MIFVAFLAFLVLFFFLLWVWHHVRKNSLLLKKRIKKRSSKAYNQGDSRG